MAEGISTRVARKLKQALGGGEVRAGVTEGTATVAATEGGVWLSIPGSDAPTPVNGNVTCDVAKGDVVGYRIEDGRLSVTGSVSKPSIGETKAVGFVEPVAEAVEELRRETVAAAARTNRVIERSRAIAGIANAAQMVAEATNQHFFSDDNGVHVTQAEQEVWEQAHEGPNMLLNSIGQLFRDGLTNLISITTQAGARAITFWDGLGNDAGNVTASFGGDGATIGKLDEPHIGIDSSSMGVMADADTAQFLISSKIGGHYEQVFRVVSDGLPFDTFTLEVNRNTLQPPQTVTKTFPRFRFSSGVTTFRVLAYMYGNAGVNRQVIYEYVPIADGTYTYTYGPLFGITATVTYTVSIDSSDVTTIAMTVLMDGTITGSSISRVTFKTMSYTSGFYENAWIDEPALRFGTFEMLDDEAIGAYSAGLGYHLLAQSDNQTAIGKYNDNDPNNAFEVGNGTANDARSNAFAVDWSGNVTAAGTLNAARQESTVTVDASLITPRSGANHVWHNGVTCTVALGFNLVSNLASNGYITIGTVPEGWRPPYTVYCSVYGNSTAVGGLQAYLQAAGGIVIRNNGPSAIGTTQNVYVAATYAM